MDNDQLLAIVTEKLAELEERMAAIQLLEIEKEEQRRKIIPPEVQIELNELDDEYQGKAEAATIIINSLKDEIKPLVSQYGKSVQGSFIVAEYRRGSEKWDGEKLKGLALAYPEIGLCHSIGQPVIAFTPKKGKK